MEKRLGKAYLIGSGLGGEATLTIQARQVLQQADVVLIDQLVDRQLLALIPAQTEVVEVGKRAGSVSFSQAQINQILVERVQAGQVVARLKSGDPLIFGRALEEVQALQSALCPFEIIPGISSALGAALFAGIPLTDKLLSRCFAVFTAHDLDLLPWASLAQIDTLVILMGSQQSDLWHRLLSAGKFPQTPVAAIVSAGRPQQKVITASLADFSQQSIPIPSPAVIVIGEVVTLRSQFAPWGQDPTGSKMPLAGKTVLVTRADTQASTLTDLLHQQGARVLEMPTLEIVPPTSWDPLDQAIQDLSRFSWLLLTSANAVTYFFERLQHQGLDSRALHGIRVAVVGTKTAAVLAPYGIRPDLMPGEFVADALLDAFPQPVPGEAILFPRVESGGRDVLVKGLQALGAEVTEVAAYQSACPAQADPVVLSALNSGQIDIITFASSKTVQHFVQLLRQAQFEFERLGSVLLVAIGPKTAETCINMLGRVDRVAHSYTLEGLVQAMQPPFGS